jgi:small subunit ribosomal protein S16
LFDKKIRYQAKSFGNIHFFISHVLVIRFQRAGRKKTPFYRVVVAEKSRSVKGRFVERVGHYNPLSEPKDVSLKKDRIEHWISMGAIPSQTAARLFSKNGIASAEKFIKQRVMKPSKAEQQAAEKAKQEAEEAAQKAAEEAASKESESSEETPSQDESPVSEATEESDSSEKAEDKETEESDGEGKKE